MKILHINTYLSSGAGNAMLRLHNGLLDNGIDSKILTLGDKNKKDIYNYMDASKKGWLKNPIKKFKLKIDHIRKNKLLKNKKYTPEIFTLPFSSFNVSIENLIKESDIINLHWIANFIDYKSFFKKIEKPVVWTLHDMNPFTGGCHYSFDCNKYINNCETCFQLQGISQRNLSELVLKEKYHALKNQNITTVTLSDWLTHCVKKSFVFSNTKNRHIPNGLSDKYFHYIEKNQARTKLGLSNDYKYILFVSDSIYNYRKGVKYIIDASKNMEENVRFLLVGKGIFEKENFINFGVINDEKKLAQIYAAADLFVIPSRADNLPNTVLESLFCGTPVVGFNVGGIKDMVKENINGNLTDEISTRSLLKTIIKAMNINFSSKDISNYAIHKFSVDNQVESYIRLYKEILEK